MMAENETPTGGVCPECGWTDGHNVESCPLVLSGEAKKMPGLPPEVAERLKGGGTTRR
jgi:hypothetical protein